jgi:hypothetical protein
MKKKGVTILNGVMLTRGDNEKNDVGVRCLCH